MRIRKQIIADAETQISAIDPTLDKAKKILQLAVDTLTQVNVAKNTQPAKRSLFGRVK